MNRRMFNALLVSVAVWFSVSAVAVEVSDFAKIRAQYVDYIMGSPDAKRAEKYMHELREDGTWSDIDYQDNKRSSWEPRKHVQRIRDMARAYRESGGALEGKKNLKEAILRAIDHFVTKGYRCRNWWYNKIGVPGPMADALVLMNDAIPKDLAGRTIEKVVSQAQIGMTGQNKVWLAQIVFVRSLFERNVSELKKALDVIMGEVRVTTEEGIQPDWSFHQHGPQQQFGNYGGAFASSITKWGMILRGTSMALSDKDVATIGSYILEGEAWVLWKGRLDLSACGRQIYRDCQIKKGRGPLGRFKRMMSIDPANRKLYEARLADNEEDRANTLVGNKHFWRSDMMVHRRPSWYASVKMSSKRVKGSETCNSENMLGLHLGDGALYVYLTGDELRNIQPVWDWRRLPGTTADQSLTQLVPRACQPPVSFVGGVSDGKTGLAVFDFRRGKLAARKAWFFEEDRIVCLGAGISSENGGQILTSVQQTLLQGPVTGEKGVISSGTRPLASGAWVHHAGIGYHVLSGDKPVLQIASQTGSWRGPYPVTGDPEKISREIFSLWFDHGASPRGQGYAYVIYPDVKSSEMNTLCCASDMRILSNTADLQAIVIRKGGMRAIFYKAGVLKYAEGRLLETDTPCLVTLDWSAKKIWVSEPTQEKSQIVLKLDGRSLTVKLPAGGNAGRTVSVPLR